MSTSKKSILVRRAFYPSNLELTRAEVSDYNARRKSLDQNQRKAQARCKAFAKIREVDDSDGKKALVSGMVAVGAVGLGALIGGPVTKAFFLGLQDSTGSTVLIPGAWKAVAGLTVQGAFGASWVTWIKSRERGIREEMERKRFQEWTRSIQISNRDLIPALTPVYTEPNPYDPSLDYFEFPIGEHYGTDGHKFSNEAFWYSVPFAGLVTGGTACFGISGSGKTAAVIKPFMRVVFGWKANVDHDATGRGMEKCSGLVLDPKGSLAGDLRDVLRHAGIDPVLEAGRTDDPSLVTLTPLLYEPHAAAEKLVREAEFEARPSIKLQRQVLGLIKSGIKSGDSLSKSLQKWAKTRGESLDKTKNDLGRGARRINGRTVYQTERQPKVSRYIGREGDFLELGFDEFRVNRIIKAHDRIQKAGHAIKKAFHYNGGVLEATLPSEEFKKARRVWQPKEGCATPIAIDRALKELLMEVERLVSALFAATTFHQTAMRTAVTLSGPELKILSGVPGTVEGDKDDMEAYADLRQIVRFMAPTKDRPGEDVAQYRVRWMAREATALTFSRNLDAVLEKFRSAARKIGWMAPAHPEARNIASELESLIGVLQMSITAAMGPAGMEVEREHGRSELVLDPSVKALLKSVESYLHPHALASIKAGHMNAFRMIQSTLPSPRPMSEAGKAAKGFAYAAPDPVVECVEEISQLRVLEDGLADDLGAWLSEVVTTGRSVMELLAGDLEGVVQAIEEGTGQPTGRNIVLRGLIERLFDHMVADLIKEVPRHLSGAFAAQIMVYPAVAMNPECLKQGALEQVCEAFLVADMDRLEFDTGRALTMAMNRVRRTDSGFETHLHGAGPIGSILKERYADETCSAAFCEAAGLAKSPGHIVLVEQHLTALIERSLATVLEIVDTAWATSRPSALSDQVLLDRMLKVWKASQAQMHKIHDIYRFGSVTNLICKMVEQSLADQAIAGVRKSQVGAMATPELAIQHLLFFEPSPYRAFWSGVPSGRVVNLASLTGFDPVWSQAIWKAILVRLQSAPESMPGWQDIRGITEVVSDYHMAMLDAFTYYVAPNSGHKVDGPFMFNPIHLPGLDIVNVASTFTKAVFGAMNKGGKSDPFWENAGNRLVTNLLNVTRILYGYATFPILARLIGAKQELEAAIKELERRRSGRLLNSTDMLEVQNILGWYYGEWETPGADKGETKTNIIATLTVVTASFLAAGYQIAFAPQRKADISFPGWEWIFREGKVVGVNLPIEKHQGVAPVVLALLNKSFQKYIMLRDSQRSQNKEILKPDPKNPRGRLRIKELEAARETVLEKMATRRLWMRALENWGRDRSGAIAGDNHADNLLNRLLPGGSKHRDQERVSDTIRTISFRRPVILDVAFAFCLGALKEKLHVDEARLRPLFSIAANGAYRTGLLVERMMTLPDLPWPAEFWDGSGYATLGVAEGAGANTRHPDIQAALRFLEAADQAVDEFASRGHLEARKLLDVAGGPEAFKRHFRALPLVLVLPKAEFFDQSVQKRLSAEKAAASVELRDCRKVGDNETNAGLSLLAKVRDLTQEIRTLEDMIQMLPNTERYVAWIVDEAHMYLEGEQDAQYASVSRSARAINLIATQGPSSIYSRMEEKTADALLINFPNRVILRQADAEEAETCSNLLGGKRRVEVVDRNVTQSFEEMHGGGGGDGRGSASGGSVQFTVKEDDRFLVEPGILVDLPAFQAVAVSWDGHQPRDPQKVWLKPDFLYCNPTLRRYDPAIGILGGPAPVKLPLAYKKGQDLYGLPVLRMLELGILGGFKKTEAV